MESLKAKELPNVKIGGEILGNMLLSTEVKFKFYVVAVIGSDFML